MTILQHQNIVSSPVFNADSDYGIGGSIFLQLKEVSAVTYATLILPIFKHVMVYLVMVHKEAIHTTKRAMQQIAKRRCPATRLERYSGCRWDAFHQTSSKNHTSHKQYSNHEQPMAHYRPKMSQNKPIQSSKPLCIKKDGRNPKMSNPGIEPGSSQPQCEILTTVRIRPTVKVGMAFMIFMLYGPSFSLLQAHQHNTHHIHHYPRQWHI